MCEYCTHLNHMKPHERNLKWVSATIGFWQTNHKSAKSVHNWSLKSVYGSCRSTSSLCEQ